MSKRLSNFSFSEFLQSDSLNPESIKNTKSGSSTFMNITNSTSNISRYEQQKSFQRSREQNLISQLQSNLKDLQNFDTKMKDWMSFRPIRSNKKQNTA